MAGYTRKNHMRGILSIFLSLFLVLAAAPLSGAEWQSQSMLQPRNGEMPLLPFLDYYIDQTFDMDIEEAASPAIADSYRPLALDKLPRSEGITWLRFTIAPLSPDGKNSTYLLDMGQSIPGVPVLFDPVRNELSGALEWRENTPAQRNILLLPEETSRAVTCYIRIDGLPGPWFAPMIRTPQNAATNMGSLSRNAAILALGVVMLLCLLRGMSEEGQWRVWTALYVAFALSQAVMGMPPASEKFNLATLAATLCPGIALMLLPHVGRHLMNTPQKSRSLDIQLLLLSLPGAVLALWPLVPGWSWLERWLDLWPAGTILFVPTALGAWIMGLGGAKRFLAGCLIPPVFVGLGIVGLDFGMPPNLLASAPIWGVALSALLITATRAQTAQKEASAKSTKKKSHSNLPKIELPGEPVISLDHPLDDPNLRLLRVGSPDSENNVAALPQDKDSTVAPTPQNQEKAHGFSPIEERENALRAPLDEILRHGAALGQCSLPPAVRQYAENMISAAGNMADIISGHGAPATENENISGRAPAEAFSLQRILRDVHDAVASFAESAGTALSWYIPPNLGRLYHGDPQELENALRMLLESSVRASRNGSVHITARRVPESSDPGHILFSITDNGAGTPPRDRSSLAISRAWEMIGRHGGYLAMEAGPDGVSIALSMRFDIQDDEEKSRSSGQHVIVASEDAARRRELVKMLDSLPCRITETSSSNETLICQGADPSALLIVHGRLAQPASADMAHRFANLARQAGFSHCDILAITRDDSQWNLLKPSGFTHAMLEPENGDALRQTIAGMLRKLDSGSGPEAEKPEDGQIGTKRKSRTVLTQETGESQPAHTQSGSSIEGPDKSEEETVIPTANAVGSKITNSGPGGYSPIMLDEQSLPLNVAFEGPEWLDAPIVRTAAEGEIAVENAEKSGERVKESEAAASQEIIPEQELFEEKVGEPAIATGAGGKNDALSPDTGGNDKAAESRNAGALEKAKDNAIMGFIKGIGKRDTRPITAADQEKDSKKPSAAAMPQAASPQTDPESIPGGKGNKAVNEGGDIAKEAMEFRDPVVAALAASLDAAMNDASKAFTGRNCEGVEKATARIATLSDNVGLRILSRMASCVERAAEANDMTALADLLPELSLAVERTRIALSQPRK